ncbi:tape measure protein [Liquorilactobacillus hordei]|uniref:tape measure protein n=1 Tax=Liquorilactobacillus hordei TaxID=468911 RepID=UPI0039EAE0A5
MSNVAATFTANINGYTSAMNKMQSATKSMSGKVSGSASTGGKSFIKMGALAGLGASVASSAFNLIKGGIGSMVSELSNSSATWKTFTQNMQGIGKSTGQINKVKSSLQDFDQKTIYSSSDMASTYSQLAAVGTKSTLKLVKGFGGLASAAENPQQAMKTLSQQATQMAAKPMVQWQDFKLMLEQTPTGIAAVAKTMGISTAQLVKNVQDGKVSTQDFFAAVEKTGTNKTFTKMAEQYKTVGQAMDGLRETLANKLQPAFNAVSQVGINAISKLVDAIGSIDAQGAANKMISAFNSLGTKLQPLALNIQTLFSNVFNGLNTAKASTVFNGLSKIASNAIDSVIAILNGFVVAAEEIWGSVSKGFSKAFQSGDIKSIVSTVNGIITNISLIIQTAIGVWAQTLSSIPWSAVFSGLKVAVGTVAGALSGLSKIMLALVQNSFFQSFAAGVLTILVAYKTIMKVYAAFEALKKAILALKILSSLIGDFKLFRVALASMAAESKIAAAAQAALNAIMAINPFVLIIAAIIAVVAALVYFFTKTQLGQKIWQDFVSFLSKAWTTIKNTAITVWNGIGSFLSNAWNSTVSGAKGIWNGLGSFFSGLWSGIENTASSAWTGLGSFFSGLWNGIISTATSLWSGFTSTLSGIWSGVVAVASAVWGVLTSFFSTLWNGIVSVALGLWNTFGSSITTIWNGIVQIASGVWGLIKAAIMGPVLLVLDLVVGNFTQLGSDVTLIWNKIVQAATTLWNGIKDVINGVVSFIVTYAETVWSAFSSFIVNIWNSIISTGQSLWNGFKSFMTSLWNGIESTTMSVWNYLVSAIPNAINTIKSIGINLWNNFKSGVSNIWDGLKSTVINAGNAIINGIHSAWNGVVSWASGLWSGVKSAIRSALSFNLWDAGKAIMDSFLNGLKSVWGSITNFVGNIASWIREHKGPISYDKKLLIPAGQAIMGGFNKSLQNAFNDVQSNVSSMASQLANTVSDSTAAVTAGDLSYSSDSNVSVQPLDPSDQKDGNVYVSNELIGDKIQTMVKQGDKLNTINKRYFR